MPLITWNLDLQYYSLILVNCKEDKSMGIDMSNYKIIFKDQVFNVINIIPTIEFNHQDKGIKKAKFIDVTYLDENG